MANYKFCEKIPYTISIQFDMSCLKKYNEYLKRFNNIVGHHLSVKYLGYEENVTEEKIEAILTKLKKLKICKSSLIVNGFKIMKSENKFFDDLLYLDIQPRHYLYDLHLQVIDLLSGEIDIFETNDFLSYIPHISCGKYNERINIDELNKNICDKEIIREWELVLHTSKNEYKIL